MPAHEPIGDTPLPRRRKNCASGRPPSVTPRSARSYSIGTRSLTRYDLDEINREIAFFSDIVGTLEGGARGPVRVQGVVVR